MCTHKWTWINIAPGVLALSGTPFQIRHQIEPKRHPQGLVPYKERFGVYENDIPIAWSVTLQATKYLAERIANERLELGLLEI